MSSGAAGGELRPARCTAAVFDRVPSWPCPAGSLDRRRRCKRTAQRGTDRCWLHRRAAAVTAAVLALAPSPPALWLRQSDCIHAGLDWHPGRVGAPIIVRGHVFTGESRAWHAYGSRYAGGFQFTLPTWDSVRGRRARSLADVAAATVSEQRRRAWLVYLRDGRSWREWPTTSRVCGLT